MYMKNIKKYINNNRFKISVPSSNDKFDLVDRSYFMSDI